MPLTRYRDKVGFVGYREISPGIYKPVSEERLCSGSVVKYSSHYSEGSNSTNPNLGIRNQISILANSFVIRNHSLIRYAYLYGRKWCVKSIEFAGRRLILDLEGIYNSPVEEAPGIDGKEPAGRAYEEVDLYE